MIRSRIQHIEVTIDGRWRIALHALLVAPAWSWIRLCDRIFGTVTVDIPVYRPKVEEGRDG